MQSTIEDDGQITIPEPLRIKLNLHKGTVLEFEEVDGQLIATKAEEGDPIASVFGCLKIEGDTDALIREMREGI